MKAVGEHYKKENHDIAKAKITRTTTAILNMRTRLGRHVHDYVVVD